MELCGKFVYVMVTLLNRGLRQQMLGCGPFRYPVMRSSIQNSPYFQLLASKMCSVVFRTFTSSVRQSRRSQSILPPLYPCKFSLKPSAYAFSHYTLFHFYQIKLKKSLPLPHLTCTQSSSLLHTHRQHTFKPFENLPIIFFFIILISSPRLAPLPTFSFHTQHMYLLLPFFL